MPQEHIDHVRGLEAVGRFFEALRPYMGDDHQVAIDELIDAGDRVVALVHHQGTAPGGGQCYAPGLRRHSPLRPPDFSSRTTEAISTPFSRPFTMS
jgi:hypothetical protein